MTAVSPDAASHARGPAIDDRDVRIWQGDAVEVLERLPAGSVHCVVTSPPFWQLRDYGTGSWEGGSDPGCDHVERLAGNVSRSNTLGRDATHPHRGTLPPGKVEARPVLYEGVCGRCGAVREDRQIGLEPTPAAWVERLVEVFGAVRRVLRDDGTVWLEVGDTYAEKDLVLAPFLLAAGLQADGWYVRSVVIWHKPNPLPESAKDRPTTSHSYVFLLSKRPRYYYDGHAIRDQAAGTTRAGNKERVLGSEVGAVGSGADLGRGVPWEGSTANARSVWTIPPEPTPFRHFATFPQALVERCLKAGTSEHGCCSACGAPWRRIVTEHLENPGNRSGNGQRERTSEVRAFDERREVSVETTGWEPTCACSEPLPGQPPPPVVPCTVLDPFMGSGTVALVARRLGRHAVGAELSEEYLAIARQRLAQLSLLA